MDAASGITGVLGRINDIGARFGVAASDSFVVVDSVPFEAFGTQYQSAVAAVDDPRPASATFSQSYAPVNPYAAGGLTGTTLSTPTTSYTGNTPPPSSTPSIQSIQAAIDGIAGPPGQRPIGGYGNMPIPSELATYGNGRIPTDRLTTIGQGGHRLYAPAAASWQNLVSAASADGISLRITDSYRSYTEQVDLAERKGLYQNGGLAAVPGTSNHGWGLAVDADVRDPATMEWLRVNGPRFGWVETTQREPWHWEFRPNQV
jgi:zinc D-Ala-D-Ala carboxypeptidase